MTDVFSLDREHIDAASDKIEQFLKEHGTDRPSVLRIRLLAEDILQQYMESPEPPREFRLTCEKKFGQLRVSLRVEGERLDPFEGETEESYFTRKLQSALVVNPVWSYNRGCNEIVFSIGKRKKIPDYAFTLGAIVLGLCLGWAACLLPEAARTALCDQYLGPVSDAIMGLLGTVSVLLIFVSITNGICGMGDVSTFRRIGKKMILRFMLLLVISMGITLLMTLPFFRIERTGGASVDFASLWQMILEIIPVNIPNAFLTDNALQVIFLAVFSGVLLLMLSVKTKTLADWIGQANIFVQTMLQQVIRLMPLVVFISLFRLAAGGGMENPAGLIKYPLLIFAVGLVISAMAFLRVTIGQHVKAGTLMKKLLPTMTIAAATASSSAAYAVNMTTCRKKLGIDGKLTEVGVPLGQILFGPAIIWEAIVGCLCMAEMYGVPLTAPKLITLMLSVLILSVAEPPVPGVTISMMTLLFAQLGIPVEAVSIVMAFDPLIDRWGTMADLMFLQTELVQLAGSLGMLDKEKLRAEKSVQSEQ